MVHSSQLLLRFMFLCVSCRLAKGFVYIVLCLFLWMLIFYTPYAAWLLVEWWKEQQQDQWIIHNLSELLPFGRSFWGMGDLEIQLWRRPTARCGLQVALAFLIFLALDFYICLSYIIYVHDSIHWINALAQSASICSSQDLHVDLFRYRLRW